MVNYVIRLNTKHGTEYLKSYCFDAGWFYDLLTSDIEEAVTFQDREYVERIKGNLERTTNSTAVVLVKPRS